LPPHSPAGQFVVTLSRARSKYDREEPFELVSQRRCATIAEMLNAFKELVAIAKEADKTDPG
jgi:hypothetical protein